MDLLAVVLRTHAPFDRPSRSQRSRGANANEVSHPTRYPTQHGCSKGHADVTEMLIDANAQLELRNCLGCVRPLHGTQSTTSTVSTFQYPSTPSRLACLHAASLTCAHFAFAKITRSAGWNGCQGTDNAGRKKTVPVMLSTVQTLLIRVSILHLRLSHCC